MMTKTTSINKTFARLDAGTQREPISREVSFLTIGMFSTECRKPKRSDQSQQTHTAQWTNQNSKQIRVIGAKRGKTRATKSRLVLVLLLIGRESGASFANQSQSVI